jgi:Predicted membrane protein (DUF2243)
MRLAGIVLGVGLGGFVDGITLHQIMQWHNMGSAVLPPTTMDAMAQNMVWDGLFSCGHTRPNPYRRADALVRWANGGKPSASVGPHGTNDIGLGALQPC